MVACAQHVVSAHNEYIVLSSGCDSGVKKGMTGKICAEETVGGRAVTNCSARFVVTSVSEEQSIAHITKGDGNSAAGKRANFDLKLVPSSKCSSRIITPPKRDEAAEFLRDADRTFREGDYGGALERYESFLHAYPNHDKVDFAANRAYECRVKLGRTATPAMVPPSSAVPAVVPPPNTTVQVTPATVPTPPPPVMSEVPSGIQQADKLAATAEHSFQLGQLRESRAAALQALRLDSTNSRAGNTLRAVQVKLVQARFNAPSDVAVIDASCYVADAGNNTIRMIKAEATTTIAGAAGEHGSTGGSALQARFNDPDGVGVAQDGTVYVCDRYNAIIRKIGSDGNVTTIAGRAGLSGKVDGAASSARFNEPRRIAIAGDGTIYVADTGNHAVRRILPGGGTVETVLTSSTSDRVDPIGLAIDANGNILIADAWSHVIRKIDHVGQLSVVAGLPGVSGSVDGPVGSARFNAPEGVAVDSDGVIYVADTANDTIRMIVNGEVTTAAGRAGLAGAVDGSGASARFNHPSGIRSDARGRLWIADSGNQAIRLMTDGFVETVSGLPGSIGTSDGTN
ncbi:MAG: hypothetical protein QOC81_193 [Thermoanaerobaculia bacterium]|jgi:sugar lactone lactonase YvrE|nr:hypothetical protein [Thermoanaerobaculia bacterium]